MQGGFYCQSAQYESEIKAEVREGFGRMKEREKMKQRLRASDTTVLWVSQSTEEEGRKKDGGGALGPWAQKVQQHSGSAA